MALKFKWNTIYLMEIKVNGMGENFSVNFFLTFFAEWFIIFVFIVPKPALQGAALR